MVIEMARVVMMMMTVMSRQSVWRFRLDSFAANDIATLATAGVPATTSTTDAATVVSGWCGHDVLSGAPLVHSEQPDAKLLDNVGLIEPRNACIEEEGK